MAVRHHTIDQRRQAVERVRRWRLDNPEHYRQQSRRRYHAARARDPERVARYDRESRARYPERVRARWVVGNALRSGLIVRPNRCDDCGERCKPHAHHSDYSKPLAVDWLCRDCHSLRHPKSVHRLADSGQARCQAVPAA